MCLTIKIDKNKKIEIKIYFIILYNSFLGNDEKTF